MAGAPATPPLAAHAPQAAVQVPLELATMQRAWLELEGQQTGSSPLAAAARKVSAEELAPPPLKAASIAGQATLLPAA
jgi:hypothetical protein